MQEKRVFFYADASRKHAQEAISLVGVGKCLKNCFYSAPKVSRYLQCFLHITHPKGCRQHSTKNSKIELPCRKNGLRQTQHSLQDLKIKKPPHRVIAHLPLGLYVDAKKNVLVLAHLARNSRIWPYSPPRSQHSPPSGPIRLHMTPDRPNIALKWPNMVTWAKIRPKYSPPTDRICCRAEHRPEVAQYKPNKS